MGETRTFSLDQIRTASPCPVKWESMRGDDVKRFCKHCSLHVYNLATMTRADAEALILGAEGRVCATYWRRADGTIITKDCPTGAAEIRAARYHWLRRVAALVGIGFGGLGLAACSRPYRTAGDVCLQEPPGTTAETAPGPSPDAEVSQ